MVLIGPVEEVAERQAGPEHRPSSTPNERSMFTRGALVLIGPEELAEDGVPPIPRKVINGPTSTRGFPLELDCIDGENEDSDEVVRTEASCTPPSNDKTGFKTGGNPTMGLVLVVEVGDEDMSREEVMVRVAVDCPPTPSRDISGTKSIIGFGRTEELLVSTLEIIEPGLVLVKNEVLHDGPAQSPSSRPKLRSIPMSGDFTSDERVGLGLPKDPPALGGVTADIPVYEVRHDGPGQRPPSKSMLGPMSTRGCLDVGDESRPCKMSGRIDRVSASCEFVDVIIESREEDANGFKTDKS